MLVVENPENFEGNVGFGSFVHLTVDVSASVRGVTDEAAVVAAKALPRATCLAWIRLYTVVPSSPLFYIVFMLVDRGLPPAPHSFAAVPIAPNTAHPETERAAVAPSRPFPWPDCYFHTLRSLEAPISRLYEPETEAELAECIKLDDEQRLSVVLAWHADMAATAEERLASAIAGGYAIRTGHRIVDHGTHVSLRRLSSTSSGSEASSRSLGSAYDASSETPGSEAGDDLVSRASPHPSPPATTQFPVCDTPSELDAENHAEEPGIVLHVEVSGVLDPSVEFGTADDFLAVVDQLSEIEYQRTERAEIARLARAAAPNTMVWLRGVHAAH